MRRFAFTVPVVQIGPDQAAVATFVESFAPPMLKAPYHGQGVRCLSALVNREDE